MDLQPENPLPTQSPDVLAELLSLGNSTSISWTPADLGAIWRHQMSAPLLFDLGDLTPKARDTISGVTASSNFPLHSFADLLNHPSPPIELLLFTKEFAKSVRAGDDAAFAAGPATVLYFSAIALGLLRANRRITEMDSAALEKGLRWCAAQPWLDAYTRSLFDDALRHVHNTVP